jgi:hypothetical protein
VPVFIESSVPPALRNALTWSFTNNYGYNLDFFRVTSGDWDVYVRAYNAGDIGYSGWVDCRPDAEQGGNHPFHHCADQQLRFNTFYPHQYDTTNEARSLVCHELGHTVGLQHPSSDTGSCMTAHDYSHLRYYGVHP